MLSDKIQSDTKYSAKLLQSCEDQDEHKFGNNLLLSVRHQVWTDNFLSLMVVDRG